MCAAAAGAVSYRPHVNAAAILLASQGNVPVEATAALMAALLDPVSTGFIAHAPAGYADVLAAAGFLEAMIAALRAEDVLCADETPVTRTATTDLRALGGLGARPARHRHAGAATQRPP